jgi:hypothetical protein
MVSHVPRVDITQECADLNRSSPAVAIHLAFDGALMIAFFLHHMNTY